MKLYKKLGPYRCLQILNKYHHAPEFVAEHRAVVQAKIVVDGSVTLIER